MFYVLPFTYFFLTRLQLSQPYGLRALVSCFTFYVLHSYLCHTVLAIMSDGTQKNAYACFTFYVLHLFLHQTVQLSQPYGLRALISLFTLYVLHSYLCHTILALMSHGTKIILHACFSFYVVHIFVAQDCVVVTAIWSQSTCILFYVLRFTQLSVPHYLGYDI